MEKQIKVLIFNDRSEYGLAWAAAMKKADIFAVVKKEHPQIIVKSVENDSPDFIIIREEMIGIIRQVRAPYAKKPKIIVFSEHYSYSAEQTVQEMGADEYVSAEISPDMLVKRIKLIDGFIPNDSSSHMDTTKNIEYIITDIISRIGIPASIKGYYYLRAAVIFMLFDEKEMQSITKQLYPAIAKHYDTTSIRVERAIRHAIDVAWERNSKEYFIETFGYIPFEKPSNFEVISTISDRVKLKYFPSLGIL